MKQSTENKVKGQLHVVKGGVKEMVGRTTNNARLKVEGLLEKVAGKVQKKIGQLEKQVAERSPEK
jgi:uncharacterized protein YjbJ (UPF0337 family)